MNQVVLFSLMRSVGWKRLLSLLAAVLCRVAAAVDPGPRTPEAMLDLPRDGALAGRLVDVPAEPGTPRKTFLWKSPAFADAFEFAIDGIVGMRFPPSSEPRPAVAGGAWRIELIDGSQLFGAVDAIDEKHVVADIGPADAPVRLRIRRDAVRSVFQGDAAATCGEVGRLADWRQSPPDTWREDVGRIVSTAAETSLFRSLRTGPRARYDVRLSWGRRPTLRLDVGGGAAGEASARYRVELLPEGMVAVREEPASDKRGSRVDLEPFGALPESGLECTLFVDRQAGRLAVMLPGGREPVADLTIPPGGDRDTEDGIMLSVVEGSVALVGLRVSPWAGGSLAVADDDGAGRIRLRDGGSLSATVERMESGSAQLAVRGRDSETRSLSVGTVEEIVFPSSGTTTGQLEAVAYPRLQATDVYGSRLMAHLQQVEQGVVWLSCSGIDEPVRLQLATLATLVSVVQPTAFQTLPGKAGRLACEQGTVWGCLVGRGTSDHDTGDGGMDEVLAWRPLGSLNASPLALAADGEQPPVSISYVEPRSPAAVTMAEGGVGGIGCHLGAVDGRPAVLAPIAGSAAEAAGLKSGDVFLAIAPRGDGRFVETERLPLEDAQHLLRGRVGSRLQLRVKSNGENEPREIAIVRQQISQLGRNPQVIQQALQVHDRLVPPLRAPLAEGALDPLGSLLILRTGETMPCRIEAIDERGVRARFAGGDAVTVASDLVQAIELVPSPGKQVSPEKFRSLTVLPRSQRQHPPTHVLRSLQGDYLRGRVVSMDEETIRIALESRSQHLPLAISRRDIARVIWLHPEELDTPWKPPVSPAGEGLPVEIVDADNHRLRVNATRITGTVLHGRSPIVGECAIDLEKIDRLLIGGGHEEKPSDMPYAQWRLHLAPEPRNRPVRGGRDGKNE